MSQRSKYKKRDTRLDEIEELMNSGIKNPVEIGVRIGLRTITVKRYISDVNSRNRNSMKMPKKKREAQIKRMFESGLGPHEIAEETELLYFTIRKYLREMDLVETQEPQEMKVDRKELTKVVYRGFNITECANRFRCSSQLISKKVELLGLRDIWKSKKRERRARKKYEENLRIRTLLGVVNGNLERKLSEVDEMDARQWAEKNAVYYRMERNRSALDYDSVIEMILPYREAEIADEKVSLLELEKRSGHFFVKISRVLRNIGKKPMIRRGHRKPISKYKKEVLRRALDTCFSYGDIGYFLGVPRYVAASNMNRYGNRSRDYGIIKKVSKRDVLSYHLASQIYEAKDVVTEWRDEDIAEYIGKGVELVEYALEKRDLIEPVIMDNLRIMFPDKDINAPYIEISD